MSENGLKAAGQAMKWTENVAPLGDNSDITPYASARPRPAGDVGAAIAQQMNGPLTALLLYMNEIKQHSHRFSQAPGERLYLQQVVENALQQTERVCVLVKQLSDHSAATETAAKRAGESQSGRATDGTRRSGLSSESGRKPLTRREREVLSLISEGCSNKQGALRMNISPRTFESHRAEAMRKLGARNTADLVRKALMQSA
jgi:DNA-binding CsgD family transcriptional regulator